MTFWAMEGRITSTRTIVCYGYLLPFSQSASKTRRWTVEFFMDPITA